MTANLFEVASKQKFRFSSVKGELSTEQLWDLPLESKTGFDLNSVAKAVNAALKAEQEEDFVSPKTNSSKNQLEMKLEVVKFIIADKKLAAENAKKRAENAERRQKLLAALEDKQNDALKGMTPEQILAELEKLES